MRLVVFRYVPRICNSVVSSINSRWCSRLDRPKQHRPLLLDVPASAAQAHAARATPSRTRRATVIWWRRVASCDVPLCRDLRASCTQVARPRASVPSDDQLATARPDAPRTPRPRMWRWLRCRCSGRSKIPPSSGQNRGHQSENVWEQN